MMSTCTYLSKIWKHYYYGNEIKKVDYWMSMNKLTLNYLKCKYMIVSKKDIDTSLFTLEKNNLSIERADCIQYLRVLPDAKLSWKYHI